MKRIVFVLIFVFSVHGLLWAQFKTETKPVNIAETLKNPLGMAKNFTGILGLNPDNLSISHSYHLGMMSGGGRSFTQGMYLNTLSYQFSIPLFVSVQWGIAHQPGSVLGSESVLNSGPFLSNAKIIYKPSESTTLRLEVQQYPGGYAPYGMSRSWSGFGWD